VSSNELRGPFMILFSFFKGRPHVFYSSFFILLAIYFAIMTIKVLQLTPVLTQETTQERNLQRIVYDYKVYPAPSILYPPGSGPLPMGEQSYFTNITQQIEFEVRGEIEDSPYTEPQADFQISLLLRSPGQWEKKMDYTPEVIAERPAQGKQVFKSNFTLPLASAMELGEAIVEELGVRPRDAYSLVIQSRIVSPPLDANDVSSGNPFVGEYAFNLRGRTIEPAGQLLYEKTETSRETATQTNYINFLGFSLNVSLARILFPALLIASLLGVGFCSLHRPRLRPGNTNQGLMEYGRIKGRYGGRIIRVGQLKDIPANSLKIEMEDFRDLVKIADERERPILQVNSQDQHINIVQFYVIDDDTFYYYQIATD